MKAFFITLTFGLVFLGILATPAEAYSFPYSTLVSDLTAGETVPFNN